MSAIKAGSSGPDAPAVTLDVDLEALETPRESIGNYLAAQRRLRGITIEELSQQTRIPLRSLERLESGSFDADVDGFVRGFVRTVAEALGLDADETLNRTLREPGTASRRAAPRLSLPRVVASVVGLALLVGVGFAIQLIVSAIGSGTTSSPRSTIVVRRDPVRALAEAQGVEALLPGPVVSSARRMPEPRSDPRPAPPAEDAPASPPLAGP